LINTKKLLYITNSSILIIIMASTTATTSTKKRSALSLPAVSKKTRIEIDPATTKKPRTECESLTPEPLARKSSPPPPLVKDDKGTKNMRDILKECLTGTLDVESPAISPILIGFALATMKSVVKNSLNVKGLLSAEQYMQEKVLVTSDSCGISKDPLVQNALRFIIKAAKGIISGEGGNFWEFGGCFPVKQKIPISIGGTLIECDIFTFENDEPAKYASDDGARCYFDALTKILYFLLKFPAFLFSNPEVQREYFAKKKGLIYTQVIENFAVTLEIRKREIQDDIAKLELDISEVEQCKLGSLSRVDAIKKEIEVDESKLKKIKHSFKTLMEDAMECVDPSDEGVEIYRAMNDAGSKHMELVTQQLNFSINEANGRLEETQKKVELEVKSSLGYVDQVERKKGEINLISKVNMADLSASLPIQISDAIEAYLEIFEPIMACASIPTSMNALIVAMKDILLSKSVVMDGMLSTKISMELFLQKTM
jgi:hypothetical protein